MSRKRVGDDPRIHFLHEGLGDQCYEIINFSVRGINLSLRLLHEATVFCAQTYVVISFFKDVSINTVLPFFVSIFKKSLS